MWKNDLLKGKLLLKRTKIKWKQSIETLVQSSCPLTSLPGVLRALVPAFCLDGAPPWADMPLLQEPVWETARAAFCPAFSGSSGRPEEAPFHLPPPSAGLSKSSSAFFSSSVPSHGSSVVGRFSESVFSYEENMTEKLCAETSIKCESGTEIYILLTG